MLLFVVYEPCGGSGALVSVVESEAFPGQRQPVTGWAADKEFREEFVSLEAMMRCLCIKEGKNATARALAERWETVLGEDMAVQSWDIGNVTAWPIPAHRKWGRGSAQVSNTP